MSEPSSIPDGWLHVPLINLVRPKRSRNPRKEGEGEFHYIDIDALDNTSQTIVSPKVLQKSEAPSRARQPVEHGNILFSLVRPYLKNIAIVPQELDGQIASTAYCVLDLRDGMRSRFVFYHLIRDSFIHSIPTYGNSPPSARDDEFLSLSVPVAPTSEQDRIVAKLDELFSDLDAGVAALERAQANLKRYRAAILKAAVDGKLTEQWRAEHSDVEPASELLARILKERRAKWEADKLAEFERKGKTPPKGWRENYVEPPSTETSELAKLPERWIWTSIGECFEVHVGATPSRSSASYWNGTIPWVSSGEVQFKRISSTREMITQKGLLESSTQLNPSGSVLLGMIGEGKTRGQTAILDVPACNNQNCAAVWVSATPVSPEYVYYWLWSQYEVTRTRGSGNNQPALNKSRVQRIPMPLPPLDEQMEIVRSIETLLSIVDKSETVVADGLCRASGLRQSILKRTFMGALVPQDATDEPTSVLLQRISAERDVVNGNDKPRRTKTK